MYQRFVSRFLCCGRSKHFGVALVDDPKYVKALQRRAASNEILGTWSSLTSAQEGLSSSFTVPAIPLSNTILILDYEALLKLLPTDKESREVENKLQKLKPRLEAAQKRETTEMVDKLKTLGNSVLGMNVQSESDVG